MTFAGPGDAVAAGIGMVHQHFMLVPVFTVAESVALGYEPTKSLGLIDLAQKPKKVTDISSRFGFDVDPDAYIENLPVGVQQRVEIIKALSRDAKILILDEPTAVLTPQETDELITIMRQLKEAGTSIVFITHKLREVRAIADRITVIRRGRVVGEATAESTETELASLMVGREVSLTTDKEDADPGDDALQVQNLSVLDGSGHVLLDDVSLSVRRGEILAVAGVDGNGQTELAQAILGTRAAASGRIALDGTDWSKLNVKVAQLRPGLCAGGPIHRWGHHRLLHHRKLCARHAPPTSLCERDGDEACGDASRRRGADGPLSTVRLGTVDDPVSTLSGGNQQKVVLAREMSRDLKVLVASQPTRGLDVGSIEFVHRTIIEERDKGTPCMIVSTELDEVSNLADRIAVMYRGRIVGVVGADTPRDVLGLMMAGVPAEEAATQAAAHKTTLSEADEVAEEERNCERAGDPGVGTARGSAGGC